MNANRWMCKQSMMRCDVWWVWMNDYENFGQSKRWIPMNIAVTSNYWWSLISAMQCKDGEVNIDLYAPEYSRRRKLERYELLDECGWISVQQAMTDASNSRWHWSCPQTLSLNVSSWFILIFWIYLIFMDNFLSFTCCCTHSSCEENETNARMLWPFF